MLPQFICVGTYRAGTTWLDAMFRQHPQVTLPYEKETMFFSHYFDKGLDWYLKFFGQPSPGKMLGEICPTYLHRAEVPGRIKDTLPEVNIFMILRDPLAQIGSMYRHSISRGEASAPLAQVLREKPFILKNACYSDQVERYLDEFGPQRVRICFFDDLKASPEDFLLGIQDWLGLGRHLPEGLHQAANAAGRPRSVFLARTMTMTAEYMRRHGLLRVKSMIAATGLVKAIKRRNTRAGTWRVEMDEQVRDIVRAELRDDILRLAALTGRNLDGWLARLEAPAP